MSSNSLLLIHTWKINLYYSCKIASTDYTSYIEESKIEPSPVVIVTANDPDSNSQISYSVIADPTNLWQIDRNTGKVTAKQPIFYRDTPADQGL